MSSEGNSDDRLKKLFVGGLNRSTSDETLKAYFEEYGELSDCVVIRDSGTKESRGFGYVTYKDPSSVIPVLQYKRDTGPHKIDGKEVEVKRAIPREDQSSTAHLKTKKIFIGGLADAATAEDIRSALAENLRNIAPTSVDLIMRKSDDGQAPSKHRGFCFVEFDDEDLVDELCCIKKIDICGKKVEIKKAEPKDKSGQGQGGGGRGRGGGRGGSRGGRSGGAPGGGGGGYYQGGGYQGGYDAYGGGYDTSYSYATQGYGTGYDAYGGMGMYQQAASGYGPQQSYPATGGRGGGRYRPY